MQKIPKLLLIGLDFKLLSVFEHLLKDTQFHSVPLDLGKLQESIKFEANIIVSTELQSEHTDQLGASLRAKFPQAHIFLLSQTVELFSRERFIKNGFSNAFLFPTDQEVFLSSLQEAISKGGSELGEYQEVKMMDAEVEDQLNFDLIVHLPTNNKYVRIIKAGDKIDPSRLEMIRACKLYVPVRQIQEFYEYTAQKIKKISTSKALTKEERKEKLVEAVKNLISGLFTETDGSELTAEAVMKNCNGIVSAYIVSTAENDWFAQIQQVLAEMGDKYAHSANVSTLAALFSIGLNIGSPEDLALAGLLHDIGKLQLPDDVQNLEPDEMNGQQFIQYKRHPELSIEIIRQKKLKVPNSVIKAIMQHHELCNGNGFPKKLFGIDICKEAQILAIADRFDRMTKAKPGRKHISPTQAVELLRIEHFNGTAKQHYDPVLYQNLLALFPQPQVVV